MENYWNGLKIEIYDLHHYSCSHAKVSHCELEPFGSLLVPIHGQTYLKCIFTIQGVLKMKNAMMWAKYWDELLQSIYLLSRKSLPLWGGVFWEPFVPNT